MENIMTTNDSPHRLQRLGRTLGLGLGLGLALLANLGDRAFSASAANSGIDPLQILDTAVKNNVLFFVDTSGSMSGVPEDENFTVGGDDPASRFYQMKRAVRDVLSANAGKANFGLATFDPNPQEAAMDPTDAMIYLSQDPTANGWIGYFNSPATPGAANLSTYNADTCTGALGVCSATEKTKLFKGFQATINGTTITNSKYPVVCTNQASNQVGNAPGAVVNPPIPHVFGTNCRYYMTSLLMRNGKRYVVTPGLASGNTRTNGAFVSSSNITCPPPPPGLLGDNVLAYADGSIPRACYQIQNATTNEITTYWATSGHFVYTNVTPGLSDCTSNGTVIGVSPCNGDASASIQANMRMELQYDAAGNAQFLPPVTNIDNAKPGITDTPPFNQVGIRQDLRTPLAGAMAFALNYFRTTVLLAAGTPQRPLVAQGKQKQFMILLTDGDETCGGNPQQAAYNLWSNTLPALPACTGACLTSKGITAAQWAKANQIELLLITFAGGTQATVNAISQAGTGRNPANGVCDPGAPCRNTFIATNITDLVNALNNAINTSTATGEFSDQQSVTETVFEFAGVGTPPQDPLDPYNRYAVSVPVLLQSTFELPGWLGHLNAFRRGDNGTPTNLADDVSIQVWDAGQTLKDRVTNATNGMGAAPADPTTCPTTGCYFFTDLYGNANTTPPLGALTSSTNNVITSTAKIKRRIFTTSQNGVNPNYTVANLLNPTTSAAALAWTRVPLWPPTVSSTDNTSVAPTETSSTSAEFRGVLDSALGFDALTTVAQVQAAVPGACQGTVAANIHPKCTSATAAIALSRAKFEARQITLAYLAGAQLAAANGVPVRTGTTGPAAGRQQLQFVVRPWVMVESTLAAPGVVTPPLLAGPKVAPGAVGVDEYKDYRDGLRTSTGAPVNGVVNGLGLRNPDRLDATTAQSVKDAAGADLTLKPSMSVVYHATNQGLHAFRAGPCPPPPAGAGLGTPVADCGVSLENPAMREMGGEELWAFVPFDVVYKLPALTKIQGRADKQYLLASPVRFADVFVPGGGSFGGKSFNGVWRTILYVGRGQGGKYYSALDITAPGPFTRHSLNTELPVVVWNRGNPDTTRGLTTAQGGVQVNPGTADYEAYLGMGETWSLPSVGFVTAASFTTPRTGTNGTNFVLFTGSGYSDVTTSVGSTHPLGEGKTFYVLDALTGDVVRSFEIPNGTPAPLPPPNTVLTNFLVAPPVVYAEDGDGNSPSGYRFIGNPIAAKAKTVYFGDLHSRIWRYNVNSPATPPSVFFAANTATDGNQPFANAVSVLQNRPDSSMPGDVLVYAEAGNDRRVPVPSEGNRPAVPGAPPFTAYAFKDPGTGAAGVLQFSRNFDTNYRGTVQPASAFAGGNASATPPVPPAPVVFYAGIQFTSTDCVGTFDSVLVALQGVVSSPGSAPVAAFDLKATGDDAFIQFTGKKINAIRVSGEGSLVVDQGLNAENPPPPPGVPVASETISSSSSLVSLGLTPGTTLFTRLAPTTVPFRIGSSVCRVAY
jgi:hypothetical protein